MKILLIGSTGTIGKAISAQLSDHEVIQANYNSGDIRVDLSEPTSITEMFRTAGEVDAVICAAGQAAFAPLKDLTDKDYELGLQNKLMGQVNLLRIGRDFVASGGSITLTAGILSRYPIPGSASIALVNGALESYVRAAALELEDLRINVVSPAWVKETMEMMGMDSSEGISAADTAKAYKVALQSEKHGETLDVTDYI